MAKIIIVAAKATSKLAVMTSVVAKIIFVVDEMTFIVPVTNFSVRHQQLVTYMLPATNKKGSANIHILFSSKPCGL